MDKQQFNQVLKQNKILTEDKLEVLDKERLQQKNPDPWEEFLVQKSFKRE